MGMFDSAMLPCPNCGRMLEFQSKSGECMLNNYNEKNLPVYVAIGINFTVVSCVCGKNIQFNLLNGEEKAKFTLEITKQERDYPGNFEETLI